MAPQPPPADERDEREGRRLLLHLAQDILPSLIARLGASGLAELEVREGAWRVRLRRTMPVGTGAQVGTRGVDQPRRAGRAAHGRAQSGSEAAATGASGNGAGSGSIAVGPGTDDGRGGTVVAAGQGRTDGARSATSPAVGYFVPRDGTGAGHPVRQGDLLGHIDVLGVRQEVVAPADGVIGRVFVEPGEAVEYGQELFRIDRLVRPTETVA